MKYNKIDIEKIITVNCDITDYYDDETDEPCRYALGAVSLKDSVIKICNVIEQAREDTAREILLPIRESYREVIRTGHITMLLDQVEELAKEYGIDLTEKEGEE